MALLKVSGLTVHYGVIQALSKLDFEVMPGEIVTFVGANGAGKTTTLNTLSGLLKKTSGDVFFENKPITHLASHQIVSLGMCLSPEGRMVFPQMSVYENLMMGAYSRRIGKLEKQREMEHMFHLFPRLKERLHQMAALLSGGEQQMVAIARALMSKPKLLMLDEPSLGISPLLTQQIFQKIGELNRNEGMTILIAEQNAHMVLKMAHRAYVLEVGQIVAAGSAAELLHNPVVRASYLGA